jgi:hypothetical protein
MQLKEIEKLTKKQLRQRVDDEFALADEKGPAYLAKAQFYMRELEHRRDSWVSRRDLFLELVVIVLIGGELYMSYTGGIQQDRQFKSQQTVLGNMETSSGETLRAITAERQTMEAMRISLERQVELYYDVQINAFYSEATQKLILTNSGRANVTVWRQRITYDSKFEVYPKPVTITPTGTFETPLTSDIRKLSQELPKGQMRVYTFEFSIKNEKQEPFTLTGDLIGMWKNDTVSFNCQSHGVVPGWRK